MNRPIRPPIRIALVGIGTIARDQHLPALAASPAFQLVASVSRSARIDGLPGFASIADLVASGLGVDAVSLATPPVGRFDAAAAALAAGWHVMLEKPPAASLSDVRALVAMAGPRTLFASWHSRESAAVPVLAAALAGARIRHVAIDWLEDIRVWHPGQDWILAAGGMGVFDPGINALSILTAILPEPVRLVAATLDVPAGRAGPIAAQLSMMAGAAPVAARLDFLHPGPPCWDITVETDAGTWHLADGGARAAHDGVAVPLAGVGEYVSLYQRFAELVAAGASDCDVRPLELVADAFMLGERRTVAPFDF